LYPDFRADFIVACGNHPSPEKADLDAIFEGYQLPDDAQVFVHDSRDNESMTEIGRLEDRPLLINKKILEYPSVLVIGSVEPHYFAGFTGGRKSLVPGLSDIESNRNNHAHAVNLEAKPLRLEGNPVAEHLDKLTALVKLPGLLSIQIVAGRNQKIIECFAGSLEESFRQAVVLAEQVYSFKCQRQYDLVIAEMRPPLDRNLYQLQKAIENTAAAVCDKGTLMAVSACHEGIGNDEFYQLAGRLTNEDMVLSHAEIENPPLGIHKLSRIIRLRQRINVRALTGLKHEILEQVFIDPAISIEAEIQKLKQGDKQQVDILLVRDAGLMAAKID
jgi:nickel-dependent lactate racemase